MIQELLGGLMEERKISIPGGLVVSHGSSSSSSSLTSSPSSMSSPSSSSEHQQSLRCPRCDSSNTKFCYYNNYNLTQPRHFCKTCRRYWTKGGALRNVPIGGGCRKAKPSPSVSAAGRSGCGKNKPDGATRLSPGLGLEQELPSSPILWSTPYSSQLLALFRASQLQNPNPNPLRMKEGRGMIAPHMVAERSAGFNEQSMAFDHLGQLAVGPSNSQFQYHEQQQQHNMLLGEVQSSGLQELHQRLRSSANCHTEQFPSVMNNAGSTAACSSSVVTATMATSGSATVLEPLPLSVGEFGYWNPALSWSDLPTSNGAFP